MLRVCGIARIIGLVQQAAGGGAGVIGEVPALGKKAVVQNTGGPERGIEDRIGLETAGEGLVEIAAGDDIVALLIFALNELAQLIGLGDFALPAVVGLEVEIDEYELLVRPLDRQIAHQQAALEIRDAQRPGEGAGERDALSLFDRVVCCCEQTAVNPADRRNRDGYKGAGVVERVDTVCEKQRRGLIDPIGAAGIGVDLLQHDKIGRLMVDGLPDPAEVAIDRVPVGGAGILSSVHEEIGFGAETGIADVPTENAEPLGGQCAVSRIAADFKAFYRVRLIFRCGQPAEKTADGKHEDQHKNQKSTQKFFHGSSS